MNLASLVIEGDQSENTELIKYREHINNLVTEGNLDLLQYSYLLDFGKDNGCITNVSWFIEIINK